MKIRNLLLLAILLIPFNTKAAEMRINCDKTTADPKTTVSCTISAYDDETSGGEGKISVTNGTVKNAEKVKCTQGEVNTNQFYCVDDYQINTINLVKYTIEVGESGTTTIAVDNAKVVGNNFATIQYNVTPVNITINGSSSGSSSQTPVSNQGTNQSSQSNQSNQSSQNNKNSQSTEQTTTDNSEETTKNPNTGSFIDIKFILVLFAILAVVLLSMKNKKKFFRI